MTTRYEEQMYNDIHRIAIALEKIAKLLEPPHIVINEMSEKEKEKCLEKLQNSYTLSSTLPICPHCGSSNVQYMYGTTTIFNDYS